MSFRSDAKMMLRVNPTVVRTSDMSLSPRLLQRNITTRSLESKKSEPGDSSANRGSNSCRQQKLPDFQMKQMINSIKHRCHNQDSMFQTQLTGNSQTSSFSRLSSVGGLLKEFSHQRILSQHKERQKSWSLQVQHLQNHIDEKKRLKVKGVQNAKKRSVYPSVMMRDQAFSQKSQELRAINHLRDRQNINQNVGWIFQLRDSKAGDLNQRQQWLPMGKNQSINAVIIPPKQSIQELFWKQEGLDNFDKKYQTISSEQSDSSDNFQKEQEMLKLQDLRSKQNDIKSIETKNEREPLRTEQQPDFKKWDKYRATWSKEGQEMTQVMMGTTLDDIKGLKIQGESVLKREIHNCLSIPSDQRLLVLNHQYNSNGEGEPGCQEETLEEYYEPTFGY